MDGTEKNSKWKLIRSAYEDLLCIGSVSVW